MRIPLNKNSFPSHSPANNKLPVALPEKQWVGHVVRRVATAPAGTSVKVVSALFVSAVALLATNSQAEAPKNNPLRHLTQKYGLSGVCCHHT